MSCLSNICYVCLKQKDKSLININSSLSANEDIIHIIGYLPCNLDWMKTKPIILICDDCCRRFRETYQFLSMCRKNSAVLQGFMAKINTVSVSNTDTEAELRVDVNNKQDDNNEKQCEETNTFESGQIIEESEDVFMNVEDAFVKEEDTWKKEAVDDEEESTMVNNSIESSDKELDTEIAVNSNTHDTDTDSDSSESTSTQGHTTNKKELNTPAKKSYKCLTCSKSFSAKSILEIHTRMHTGEKLYKCARCEKSFDYLSLLLRHTRTHAEKPHECVTCKKRFDCKYTLVAHMRLHTGGKLNKKRVFNSTC